MVYSFSQQIHAKHFNKIVTKYSLNAFCMPGTLLDTEKKTFLYLNSYSMMGMTDVKQVSATK